MAEPSGGPKGAHTLHPVHSLAFLYPRQGGSSYEPLLPQHPGLLKAAMIVDQALGGRQLPEASTPNPRLQWAFELFHRLNPLRIPAILSLLVLPFVEVPLWCTQPFPHPCGDPAVVPLSRIPYLQRHVSLGIEVAALATLALLVGLQLRFLGWQLGLRYRVPIYQAALIGTALLEVGLQWTALHFPGVPYMLRLSSYLRVCIAVIFSRSMRTCVRASARVLVNLIDSAGLLAAFVLLSAWVGTAIFRDTEQGRVYFQDFPSALLNMHILLTTANNPDVWIPAFTEFRVSFFFFAGYLLTALFFLMNFLYSAISSNYKSQLASMAVRRGTRRLKGLQSAFQLLDADGDGRVEAVVVGQLLAVLRGQGAQRRRTAIHASYAVLPRLSEGEGQGGLGGEGGETHLPFQEFQRRLMAFADASGRDSLMTPQDQPPAPQPPLSASQQRVADVVCSPGFETGVLWSLGATFVLVIAQIVTTNSLVQQQLLYVEIAVALLWLPEMAAKVFATGGRAYLDSGVNWWDGITTLLASGLAVEWLLQTGPSGPLHWLQVPLFLRSLRATSLMSALPSWRRLVPACAAAVPKALPAIGLQLAVSTLFCLLGVQLFGGIVYYGNPDLKGTQYDAGGYYPFNYNDFASAMASSFQLCVVNNWFIIMDGYRAASGTWTSRIFFVAFWALAVTFCLNLVVAFVLEIFIAHVEEEEEAAAAARPEES